MNHLTGIEPTTSQISGRVSTLKLLSHDEHKSQLAGFKEKCVGKIDNLPQTVKVKCLTSPTGGRRTQLTD